MYFYLILVTFKAAKLFCLFYSKDYSMENGFFFILLTHCLYNQDIKSTKWQIPIIIEKKSGRLLIYSYFLSDHRYISQ